MRVEMGFENSGVSFVIMKFIEQRRLFPWETRNWKTELHHLVAGNLRFLLNVSV